MAESPLPDVGKPVHISSMKHLAQSGIYFLQRDGIVVYVGKAVNVRRRVCDHIAEGVKEFDAVSFIACDEHRLDWTERRYIVKLLPKYNRCPLSRRTRAHRTGLKINLAQPSIGAPLLDSAAAAEFLGISLAQFWKLLSSGRGPRSHRESRCRLRAWRPSDLVEFAADFPELVPAPTSR